MKATDTATVAIPSALIEALRSFPRSPLFSIVDNLLQTRPSTFMPSVRIAKNGLRFGLSRPSRNWKTCLTLCSSG